MIALPNQDTRHITKPGARAKSTTQQGDSDSEDILCIDFSISLKMVLGFTLRYCHK